MEIIEAEEGPDYIQILMSSSLYLSIENSWDSAIEKQLNDL